MVVVMNYNPIDQDIKGLTGRSWREVLAHGLFFMWPRVLDRWLGDRPGHKWWREGGSHAFYKYESFLFQCLFNSLYSNLPSRPKIYNNRQQNVLSVVTKVGKFKSII